MRGLKRLSHLGVRKLAAEGKPGMYADGDNLYLAVAGSGIASWIFRYMFAGRVREMGLGPLRHVKLAEARVLADEARALKRRGTDPLAVKQAKNAGAALTRAKATTFAQAAKAYMLQQQASWKSADHKRQWANSLERYVFPIIGHLPVESIDPALVLKVLEQPIQAPSGADFWHEKPVTADRVRNRIEMVLDAAKARGQREGDNPARWQGRIETLLPPPRQIKAVEHHPALHYAEIAGFMSDLRALDDADARALELTILCGLRTSEVLTAPWSEFNDRDLAQRLWVIPAARMKGRRDRKRDHRVALSQAAVAIIEKQRAIRSNDFVFAGDKDGHASDNTLRKVVKRLKREVKMTPHGFRSTFRDWVGEEPIGVAGEVAELALGHTVGDKVEAAYRRGDMFKKRTALAEMWAAYCAGVPVGAEVVDLAEVRSA